MVGVADPRECTQGANHDSDVCYNPHDKDSVVVDIEVPEIVDDLEQ